MTFTLKPCPFCGHQPEEENLIDSVHPNRDGTVWTAGCVYSEGGCDAYVLDSTREQAIAKWNLRASDKARLFSAIPQRIMILCPTCGNKRCPRASNALFRCTNSNDVGQAGELDAQPSGD